MSTLAFQGPEISIAADEFSALEQRVLRTVELLKTEREARAAAEKQAAELTQSLESRTAELVRLETELETFKKDRDVVRQRIERLLKQLDDLSA
jgi:chromosome segregation ATPase